METHKIEYKGYLPGAIGRLTELESQYYHKTWGFDRFFEATIASTLATFVSGFDPERDGFWTVVIDGRIEGAIAVDGSQAEDAGAQFRWFFLNPLFRGRGIGNTLMEKAKGFCIGKGYVRAWLDTFEGLDTARHLYEKFGFKLVSQHKGSQWGKPMNEQKFVLDLPNHEI